MSKEKAAYVSESDFKRLPWRCIGPALMSGRVSCLAFEPGNTKCYYVGFASGGLWRTDNLGTTFTPLFDREVTSSIGSVCVLDAPENWSGWTKEDKKDKDFAKKGKGKIIWVGTGEGNGRNSSSWGNGVYRSTDRGEGWFHCGLSDSHDIPAICADPRNPDVCYVAALGHLWGRNSTRGVYKTSDAGQTWVPVLHIDDKTGCVDLKMDPSNPDVLYAAMYERLRTPYSYKSGGEQGGIYKSTDAGQTWVKLTNGLPRMTGRIGLDIFKGDSNVIIATVQSDEGGQSSIRDDRSRAGGVFRSEDGGATWTRMAQRTPRPFYFSTIVFDPKDSQRVYQLGWYVEVSDDGGRTFRTGLGNKMHVDMHAFLVDPENPDFLINGSDGGVYQSFDRGKTWAFLNTMAVGQFYNISVDDGDPYRVIGGLQDNGSWIGPSSGNRESDKEEGDMKTGITNFDWQCVLGGDGFHCDFDPLDKDVVYAEWQGGNLTRINMRTGERRRLIPDPSEGSVAYRFNWNSPFFVSKHDPTVLYHAGNHVFRMTQRGEHYECISPNLTVSAPETIGTTGSSAETYGTIVALAESDLKAGVLWAGSDDGLIHISTDGGKKWANVTPKAVGGLYVSRIEASHHDVATAYASIDGHRSDNMDPLILMTTDSGKTWKDITGDLPKGWSVKVVREDLRNKEVLCCGTESAVYVSFNRGRNWVKMNGKALPTTPVDDIKQHPRTFDLILGTHGRSIWILDDASFMSSVGTASGGIELFEVQPCRPKFYMPYSGLCTDQIFRAQNRKIGAFFNYWVSEYDADDVSISITNEKGLEVAKVSGGNAPGWNRAVWDLQPLETQRLADNWQEPWQPFYVAPGVYTATLTRGKTKLKQTFEVLEMLK